MAPLVLTLQFDEVSFARFDALRRAHFPARLNLIPAHLTLFHHLPGSETGEIVRDLARLCSREIPFGLEAIGLMFMGRGCAYRFSSPELSALRARLAAIWSEWLTPQDRQGFRPHVTIQNKAEPKEARALFERL